MSICKSCHKQYASGEVDDGYCSNECWEKENCGEPELPEPIMEEELA